MDNLEIYINTPMDEIDPLIKMGIIHHQFESIHPFFDGNGRTGRILNILYLVQNDLLDMPILYLSKYIINTKADYYNLLQQVRDTGNWDEWILYMLRGIEKTSIDTMNMIDKIWELMGDMKHRMKVDLPSIYSKDLLEILFSQPYTKIDFLVEGLGITRQTASTHLKILSEAGYLNMIQVGKNKYFINQELFTLLKKGI